MYGAKASLRLLLVEDDPFYADLLERGLASRRSGLEIVRVATLEETLSQLGSGKFDAVVADLSLPDSRGIETFLQIHSAAPATPVVVITGLQDESLAMQAMENGAQDYLYKNELDGAALLHAVQWAIARRAAASRGSDRMPADTTVGASDSATAPERLRSRDPDKYGALVDMYCAALDGALERWVYRSDTRSGDEVEQLAGELIAVHAGARDVIDIHTDALREKGAASPPAKQQVFVDEGRLLALQLVGRLANHYRAIALRASEVGG